MRKKRDKDVPHQALMELVASAQRVEQRTGRAAEVEPCPACDRNPFVCDAEPSKSPAKRWWSFRCECGARQVMAVTRGDAVSAWNGCAVAVRAKGGV